jgi:3-methyladenine DNA glycosylase AlkD
MNKVEQLHNSIVADLERAGGESRYRADADEPDPRYMSYGVRAAGKKEIFRAHRPTIRRLDQQEQMELARQLVESEYGEQQSMALFILEPFADYFSPDKFSELDHLVRCLHGWSKIDAYTGSLLREVLFLHPKELIDLIGQWNLDEDLWLRRASVVLFTRKVAESGQFNDRALNFCENLIYDPEILVQKGVGWSLKDLMRVDKERIVDFVVDLRAGGVSGAITQYAIKDLKDDERAAILGITYPHLLIPS